MVRSDQPVVAPKSPKPAIEVRALSERWELAIEFPKLDGYRVELPDEPLHADFDADSVLRLDQSSAALWTESAGVVGADDAVDNEDLELLAEVAALEHGLAP